ncbi:MAG TPA: hypothetical protein VH063_18160 [Gaiellaceae bacterium]|nr:hypothetical protein [Gaiellaceae bacterium]
MWPRKGGPLRRASLVFWAAERASATDDWTRFEWQQDETEP